MQNKIVQFKCEDMECQDVFCSQVSHWYFKPPRYELGIRITKDCTFLNNTQTMIARLQKYKKYVSNGEFSRLENKDDEFWGDFWFMFGLEVFYLFEYGAKNNRDNKDERQA